MVEPEKARNDIYRSEQMCLAQLFLQSESAYQCVAQLGELGLVQFRDLNADVSAFQRKYVKEVRRCDEMERKLRFLEREIKKDQISMLDTGESPEAPLPREMIDLEATFEKLENELKDVNRNEDALKKNYSELIELKHILRKTQIFFEEVEHDRSRAGFSDLSVLGDEEPLITIASPDEEISASPAHALQMKLGFVAGVIQRERLPAFERLLWRACKGNVFLRTTPIDEFLQDSVTGDSVLKTVFIVFFQGDQLKTKVKKICEGFRATPYPCPDTAGERREMSIGIMTRIEDLKTVLGQTQDHRHRVLVAASKNIRLWLTKVRKIKSIYHTLNMFNIDVTQKCLIAEVWCPVDEMGRISAALRKGTEDSGSHMPSILNRMETTAVPPTYHKTNKFTQGFQNIVDSYGIANYREINPAPYTIISFPFLFAVMFGDMGHGLIMLLAGLFFILLEKRLEAARIKDEIFQTFFGGRYIILLMGAFSIYTGLIYNDVFSKSMNIFGSSWKNTYPHNVLDWIDGERSLMLVPELAYYTKNCSGDSPGPYPIGVDPIWNLAETNKLNFLNSMKMKSSVLLGIMQMTFGVILSYHNYKYFKSDLDIKFMFIPQMLFLSCIFVYLCIQIVVKWLVYTPDGCMQPVFGFPYPGSSCAPSLLVGLINMFMFKPRSAGFITDEDPCYLNYWYPGQQFIEYFLLVVAIACVPVMLLAKPYLLWIAQKKRRDLDGSRWGTAELVLLLVAIVQVPVMLFAKPFLMLRRRRQQTQYSTFHEESVRADMAENEIEVQHHDAVPVEHAHHEEQSMGDIMVYQAIHTIEFVLGCISHTASYLRLWALSLAHAQLSDVLWTMVFRHAFALDDKIGAVALYIIFFVFFVLSVGILVLMEGLSAFLHALRLHWVEFQSKFYGGSGHAFVPFSFAKILEEESQIDEAAV